MSGRTVRVGLIGCGGNMTRAHVPRLKGIPGVKIVAASDPSDAAAQALAAAVGRPPALYSDYRAMLAKESLDAVLISTPHNLHHAQARAALEAGLHVLVEKPLTITSAHAAGLLGLARRKRRILHVSYQRHHDPVYTHVRSLVAGGAIGRICGVVAYVTQHWQPGPKSWRGDPRVAGGGMFMDTGSHLVAAMFFLTGLRVREATALIDHAGFKVDITTAVGLRFDTGAIGSLTTVGNARQHDEGFTIHGTEGSIVLRQHQWKSCGAWLNGEPLEIPKSLAPDSPDTAFVRWIRGGKGYEPPAYAVEVARLSEAVYKSAARRRVVAVARGA